MIMETDDSVLAVDTPINDDDDIDCITDKVSDTISTVLTVLLIIMVGVGIVSDVLMVALINVEISSVTETSTDGVTDVIIVLELAGKLKCELLVDDIPDTVKPSDDATISVDMSKSVCNKLDSIIIGIVEVGEMESKQSEKFTSSIDNSSSLRFDITLIINCMTD